MDNLFSKISESWDEPNGFFYKIRDQNVDFIQGNEIVQILKKIEFADDELIEKYKIKLLWYIPIYMEWQYERLKDFQSGNKKVLDNYLLLQASMLNEIERILDVP